MRHRMEAIAPNSCGTPAVGKTEEFKTCFGPGLTSTGDSDLTSGTVCNRDCEFTDWQDWKERDCVLSTWDPWSRCSEEGDGGTQRRARIILQMPGRTGAMCNASLAQFQTCNKNKCPISAC